MRVSILLTSAITIVACNALYILKQEAYSAGIRAPIQQRDISHPGDVFSQRLSPRQNSGSGPLGQGGAYIIQMKVGGRNIRLIVDTGSSDAVILTDRFQSCQRAGSYCSKFGTIDSWNRLNPPQSFHTQYASGMSISGEIVSATFTFSSQSVEDVRFGIPTSLSTLDHNVLGLGYPINEAVEGSPYPNFPSAIQNQGLIKTTLYSLWLNSVSASAGSILFGGIDASKFNGKLTTFKVRSEHGQYRQFLLEIKSVSFAGKKIPGSYLAVVDSGYTGSSFPLSLAQNIWAAAGVHDSNIDQATGYPMVDCNFGNSLSVPFMDFDFGSAKFRVPLSELLIRLASGQCLLGIAAASGAGNHQPLLGVTFLRSVYAVFDLYNNEISLAQANFHPGSSRIIEIDTGGVRSLRLAEEGEEGSLNALKTDFTGDEAPASEVLGSSTTANTQDPIASIFGQGESPAGALASGNSGDSSLFQGFTDAALLSQDTAPKVADIEIPSPGEAINPSIDTPEPKSQEAMNFASVFNPSLNTDETGQANIGLIPNDWSNQNAATRFLPQGKMQDSASATDSKVFNSQGVEAFNARTVQLPGHDPVASNSQSSITPGSIAAAGTESQPIAFNYDDTSNLLLGL
ncbi:hypothetical protein MMC31_000161 [Peltigera leucophlebia]|nr:hypothetical protein [Peltigera leucophlebia]